MLENKIPLFEKGRILTKEALERLRDYPAEIIRLLLAEDSNGIVNGFELRYEAGMLYVGSGILKHGEILYLLTQEQKVPLKQFGVEYRLALCPDPPAETPDYYSNRFSVKLLQGLESQKEQAYELGRFRLEEGAVLRTWADYLDFQDASTQVNTIGIQGRQYSGKSGCTLSPVLTSLYAREFLTFCEIQALDAAFCMQCLNEKIMERRAVIQYLLVCGISVPQDAQPEQLYQGLLRILKERKQGRSDNLEFGKRKSRRTWIE